MSIDSIFNLGKGMKELIGELPKLSNKYDILFGFLIAAVVAVVFWPQMVSYAGESSFEGLLFLVLVGVYAAVILAFHAVVKLATFVKVLAGKVLRWVSVLVLRWSSALKRRSRHKAKVERACILMSRMDEGEVSLIREVHKAGKVTKPICTWPGYDYRMEVISNCCEIGAIKLVPPNSDRYMYFELSEEFKDAFILFDGRKKKG